MTNFSRSAWPTLVQAKEKESPAKRPALRQRASSNLDPAVPVFVPNPQVVPKIELNPQTRPQEISLNPLNLYSQEKQNSHQQRHLPEDYEPRQSFVAPPLTQLEVHKHYEHDQSFDPCQQSGVPFSPFPIDPSPLAHINGFHQAFDSIATAFFEGPNPFIGAAEVKEPEHKNIKQCSRAARWREKKAFEANQRAQIANSNISFENGEFVGHYPEALEFAPSSVDESEWKFEEPLPPKTHPAPGFCREDGSWVNTSAIRDDGQDRAAYELQHRVGLNRQQHYLKKAPIKPIARLLHKEIREQWFSNDRPLVRLNETMFGYAKRVAEMKDMSEEDLELLVRDRQAGVRVKEIALVYQGVQFPLQKEYFGDGVWR